MFGKAKVKTSIDAVYVRFDNVRPLMFKVLKTRFDNAFPLKEWDAKQRMWCLPPGDLDDILKFCADVFGPKGFAVEPYTNPPGPIQTTFDF